VPLPKRIVAGLKEQIELARERWLKDRELGVEGVFLPEALSVKYMNAERNGAGIGCFRQMHSRRTLGRKKSGVITWGENGVQQLVKRCASAGGD